MCGRDVFPAINFVADAGEALRSAVGLPPFAGQRGRATFVVSENGTVAGIVSEKGRGAGVACADSWSLGLLALDL